MLETESLLLGLAGIFVLGIGAQWLAWRFSIPSILLLLLAGFVAGPVTGFLDPDRLLGDLLFPFVSLSVGIILFEGGLSLHVAELREVGQAVFNLITIGVLLTWGLTTAAAHYLAGFSVSMAVLIGAILTVTGPTVIIPLLRHIRPNGRVGAIAKWEGITIDPVGAILAVLVLETILIVHQPAAEAGGFSSAVLHAVTALFKEIFIGGGAGLAGAGLLILLLRRRLVPDYLQNPMALLFVIVVFVLANTLQEEAGLLATTVMGLVMANQRYVPVRRIAAFKEDLRVLLIAALFIILSARLQRSDLQYINTGTLLFLGALMLLIRPANVLLSSLGANLSWKEQAFLAWLAPRGIVAAAVASLFSLQLEAVFPDEIGRLVPVTFLVIVGTVALYSLTISPLARWLGLAQPNPQGLLLLGAHPWARRLAEAVHEQGFDVLLIDTNLLHVRQARRQGLRAQRANALSEAIIDDLDLSGIGRLLTLTPNDEINALAALHFAEIFESEAIYQLTTHAAAPEADLPQHLRGRPLFDEGVTYTSLTERFDAGAEIEVLTLQEDENLARLRERYEGRLIPLFTVRGPTQLQVVSADAEPALSPGDVLLALVGGVSEDDVPAEDGEPQAGLPALRKN